ncbi:hypothetical protein [Comamonas thiooxydans]
MARVQNVVVVRGFVTTRILAAPQDLTLAGNLCNNAPSGNLGWNVHWLIRGALRVQVFVPPLPIQRSEFGEGIA